MAFLSQKCFDVFPEEVELHKNMMGLVVGTDFVLIERKLNRHFVYISIIKDSLLK